MSSHQPLYFLLKCCCRRGKLLFRIISNKDLKLQELKLHVLSRMVIQYRMICLKATFCYFLSNVYIREQTSLEEGEIPWLQYNEVNESSSDEGNEPANEFAQPEAFMLDGNNNLEDDSSVSEDLDVDWRYVAVSLHTLLLTERVMVGTASDGYDRCLPVSFQMSLSLWTIFLFSHPSVG